MRLAIQVNHPAAPIAAPTLEAVKAPNKYGMRQGILIRGSGKSNHHICRAVSRLYVVKLRHLPLISIFSAANNCDICVRNGIAARSPISKSFAPKNKANPVMNGLPVRVMNMVA